MEKFLAILLMSVLFISSATISGTVVNGQSTDSYSLQLQGFAWNHATLSALLITAGNESWWNPTYLNDTLRAIGQWNEAIEEFASNYSDFNYLSNLRFSYQVANETKPGYDLYINWTESSSSDSSDEVGLAKTFIRGDNTIVNCTIILAAKTNHGVTLSPTDMQNVALHELGHGLGLGHCNYTGDLMYSLYRLGDSPARVSTLDMFGVSTVFGWILNPSDFLPIGGWFKENSVTLPSQINYLDLQVSSRNTPPQTLTDNVVVQFLVLMIGILLHPEIGVPVALVIVLFVVLAFIPRRKNRIAAMVGS